MPKLSITLFVRACFHDIRSLTLIGNHVKCKRFYKMAGSGQAGLPPDGMGLKRNGRTQLSVQSHVPYKRRFIIASIPPPPDTSNYGDDEEVEL